MKFVFVLSYFVGCGNFLQEDCYCVNDDCRREQKRRQEIELRKKLKREQFQCIQFFSLFFFFFFLNLSIQFPWMVSKSWHQVLSKLPFSN